MVPSCAFALPLDVLVNQHSIARAAHSRVPAASRHDLAGRLGTNR